MARLRTHNRRALKGLRRSFGYFVRHCNKYGRPPYGYAWAREKSRFIHPSTFPLADYSAVKEDLMASFYGPTMDDQFRMNRIWRLIE
jgi:hypothetical protein